MTDPQTPKLTSNGICWSDGTNILCDGTAGLASGGGTVADNITSGTTRVTANTTGYISFTTAGTTTGYMNTSGVFVLPGVSATGPISATNSYYTNGLVIGGSGSMPGWMAGNGLYVGGSYSAQFTGSVFVSSGRTFAWDNYNALYGDSTNKYISVITSGTEAMRIVSTGQVGIGTSSPNGRLEVIGSLVAGEFDRNMAWNSSGSNWYYTSANTAALAIRSLTTASSTQFYVAPGGAQGATATVKSAMVLDGNTGNVAVGNGNVYPSATLHVGGSVLTTSWTGINFSGSNVTPTAPLEVSGTVSATRFVGDGSGLTGIVGASSGDNIASGTTKVTANTTGYISFTTGGTTTGYMDTAGKFILPGVSATGPISATSVYANNMQVSGSLYVSTNIVGGFFWPANFGGISWGTGSTDYVIGAGGSNHMVSIGTSGTEAMRIVSTGYVGIGTNAPSGTLHVYSTANTSVTFSANDGSGAGTRIMFDVQANTNNRTMTIGGSTIQVSKTNFLAGAQPLLLNPNGGNLSVNTFSNIAALQVSGTAIHTSWTALNMSTTPTAPLEVSGTVSATRFVGDGSGLTGIVGASSGDNIASGTTKVTANTTGYVSFTTGGVTTGYMNTAGNFILPGVSTTNSGVSASTGYFPNSLTVGTTATSNSTAVTLLGRASINGALLSYLAGTGNAGFGPAITTSGINNTFMGVLALSNNSGGFNNAFGRNALTNNTTGTNNNAFGVQSLEQNLTGGFNAAFGDGALQNNLVTGNSGFGTGALRYNDRGSNNVAVGTNAAVGVSGSTTITNTVSVGGYSGGALTTGVNNIFLGAYAGRYVTTGSSNILIGYDASPSAATTGNALNIGNSIFGDMTNAASAVGGAAKIGINYVSPSVALEVSGTVSATRFVGDGSGLTGIIGASSGDNIASGTTKVTANATGYVSFTTGGTTTGYMNTVGNFILPGISTTGPISTTNAYLSGNITAVGSVVAAGGVTVNNGTNFGWSGVTDYLTGNGSLHYIAAVTSGTEAMRIVSTGYVGIGTSTPSYTLDVNGYIRSKQRVQVYAGPSLANILMDLTGLHSNAWGYGMVLDTTSASGFTNANQIYLHSNGNVGVGTATPTAPLEVSGTISATRFVGDGSLLTGIVGASGGDNIASGTTKVTANTTGYISFTTGGTTTGYMDSSGRFILPGVSTTGTVSATNAYISGLLGIGRNPGSGYSVDAAQAIRTGNVVQTAIGAASAPAHTFTLDNTTGMFMPTSVTLAFSASGTEAMRIVSTGYVGIGTFDPSVTLHIVKNNAANTAILAINNYTAGSTQATLLSIGSDASAGNLFSTSSAYADSATFDPNPVAKAFYIRSSSAATGGLQFLTSGGSTADIVFKPGAGEAMRVRSLNGYVGMGTPSPTAKLEVSGTVSATRFVGDGSLLTGISAGSVSTGASGSLVYRDQSGNLVASSSLSISSTTGSVGIGAGAPANIGNNALYTSGHIYANGYLYGSGMSFSGSTGSLLWAGNTVSIGGNSNSNQNYLTFNTSSTEAMRITSTGLVGIGTTAPVAKLDVSGTIRTPQVTMPNGGSINAASNAIDFTGNNYLTFTTSGTEAMRIVSSGYVGIGTGSPNSKLEVNGTVSATGVRAALGVTATTVYATTMGVGLVAPAAPGGFPALSVVADTGLFAPLNVANTNSTGYTYLTVSGTARTYGIGVGNGSESGIGVANKFFIYDWTAGGTNMRMVIDSSGNMGVGTVNPNARLDVVGTVSGTTGQFNSLGTGLIAATGISVTTNRTSVTTLYASGAVQFANYGAGTLTTDASGNITASSDERLKDIRGSFARGLEAITSLNPIVYRWNAKSGNDTSGTYAGFSAQDVAKAIPEAVGTDQRGYLTLSDRPIEAALVNAVKELKAANDNLRADNDDLRKRLESQQRDIDELKKRAGQR
ncbi:hypothetical protein C7U89_01460 [Bradyrhizobium sp. WBOS4]|nr:hypothetical protein [Bradyrhizobium sp. WBOS8]MDD1581623.1 hypothetical protein [Bradyrhizobium sp. WBOS4]UUO49894.1 hypothetical protein DCM78_25085 [Bradyrhizobium sp. WBOS04]UUO58661.1 hypothetical protein DCM80_05365 [Bradyrhizobium sp. WBOS08]